MITGDHYVIDPETECWIWQGAINDQARTDLRLYRETDVLIFQSLQKGRVQVDTSTGAVYTPAGERAELLDTTKGYGKVLIGTQRYAYAHRVVWIAIHGLISPWELVTHTNGKPWDNHPSNLELITKAVRVGKLVPYAA